MLAIRIAYACSLADPMDIVTDAVPDAYYKPEEDPSQYVSATTGRGPLTRTWRTEYRDACYSKCGTGAGTGTQSSSSPSSPSPTHSQHSSPSPARTPKGSSEREREQTASPTATATAGANAATSNSGLESNNASVESSVGIAAVKQSADKEKEEKYKQKAFMCAYKVVRINLSIWGLQTRGEAWIESGTHSCD